MGLSINNLTMVFNEHTAVDDISLHVEEGEMYGFLGGNGAGKTTTFRMILNLLKPTKGTITWNDTHINYDVTDMIGYLPEDRGLHPKLTVQEQVTYLGRLKGMSQRDALEALKYWLDRFCVSENLNKKIGSLSKGNQQKIQLIASIIHNPKLIILDEPFSGLDPVNVELLKEAVLELNKNGATIIFSSHRMEHVEELCESICILNKGKQVLSGKISDIKRSYKEKRMTITGEHDLAFLKNAPGVLEYTKKNDTITLKIAEESYAKDIYETISSIGYFKKISVEDPTLNEIFIEKVGRK